MKKVLILEDSQERIDAFKLWLPVYLKGEEVQIFHADKVHIAQKLFLDHKPFDLILLDHDLDQRVYVSVTEYNTGSRFATWLASRSEDLVHTQILIHSMNGVGSGNMKKIFQTERIPCQVIPYPMLMDLLTSKK